MKYLFLIVLLASCGQRSLSTATDQCLRQEIFQQCIQSLPEGPKSTITNDWDEVIQSCSTHAYYGAQKDIKFVKPECVL